MLKVVEGNSPYGARLITVDPISRGELFFHIEHYRMIDRPTFQTIQVAADQHIEELGVLAFLNHSCIPNTIVHATQLACIASRDIPAGEELNFFYPSTEWNMARPFVCMCGAPGCIRMVTGARHVPIDVLSRYFINEHIRQLAQQSLEAGEREFFAQTAESVP